MLPLGSSKRALQGIKKRGTKRVLHVRLSTILVLIAVRHRVPRYPTSEGGGLIGEMKKEVLILVINVALAAAAGLIIVLFHLCPTFTLYLLGVCLCSFVFILTEKWQTHHAAEFENRFWTLMAFLLARTCLFVEDSPFRFPEERQGVAWCIVWLFTYLAHNYDRHLRRLGLIRTPNIKRIPSASIGEALKESAKEKAVMIIDHVSRIVC